MSNSETVTAVTTKANVPSDVIVTSTATGPVETVTVAKLKDGPEVTTTVRSGQSRKEDSAELQAYVAIWSKAVDTQMHFNEMSVKSRQLGLTFVVAALGLAVVLLSQSKDYSLHLYGPFHLHVAVLLIVAGAGAISLVKMLDLGVYHRMLRGAVAFGEELEELKLKPLLGVQKGMTQAISFFSRNPGARFSQETNPRYSTTQDAVTAGTKIERFYSRTVIVLYAAAILVFSVTSYKPNPVQATSVSGADPSETRKVDGQ